jgi:hypothetical protein
MTGAPTKAAYRLGVALQSDRAAVESVRLAAFRRATEFDWNDEARLMWSRADDQGTVLALWDAHGELLSTVRASVFANTSGAECFLEYSLAGMEIGAPLLVLSRAATSPAASRQGFNSIVRYAYVSAALSVPVAGLATLVYEGGPRLRSMREAGFALTPPCAGWDSEAVARTQPLMAHLPRQRFAAAASQIAGALAERLADVQIDWCAITASLAAQCEQARRAAEGMAEML